MIRTKTCPECGHQYKRKTCECCSRLKRWQNTVSWDKRLIAFPPRIRNELPIMLKDPPDFHGFPDPVKYISNNNLYVFGSVGTGKTLFVAKVAYLQMQQSIALATHFKHPVFITMPDLLQEIQSTFSKNSEVSGYDVLNKYRKAEFLIIDDFGTEKPSDWSYQILYSIINYRYEHILQTIFTSNFSLKQIADQLSDDRIPSRIGAMCIVMQLKTNMRRKG